MLLDHFGIFFYPEETWLRIIGRAVVPILFFLGGYFHASTTRKEIIFLGVYMTLTAPILWQHGSLLPLDTILSLVVGRWFSHLTDKTEAPFYSIASIALIPLLMGVVSYTAAFVCIPLIGKAKRENWPNTCKMICVCSGFIIYAASQWLGRGYNTETTILLGLWLTLIFSVLGFATLSNKWELRSPITVLKKYPRSAQGLLIVSNNSLSIYFAHVAIFSLLSQILKWYVS
jgi:hypothetical protein